MFSSIEENQETIAQYLPEGGVWDHKLDNIRKPDGTYSTMGSLVYSLANLLNSYRNYDQELYDELNIFKTKNFIEYWEQYVGIPDEIFIVEDTLEKRIQNIIFKLVALRSKTKTEIKLIIKNLYNIDIEIFNKKEAKSFDYTFDFYLSSNYDGIFTIVEIQNQTLQDNSSFDYIFDFPLASTDQAPIELIIKSLAPFDKVNFILFHYI